jgi:hypothetical protein
LIGVTTPSWALDVKWGGDYRLRGFYIDNLTDQDSDTQDAAAYYSSRFLLTTAVSEDGVSGVVTLIAGSSRDSTTNNINNGNRLLGRSSYGPDGSYVGILEAYIKADFARWAFTGGRKVYKLGHGIVLDDAVDGLWAEFDAGPAAVTVATLKLNERTNDTVVGIGNTTADGTAGDADLYVLNARFGQMPTGTHAGSHTDVALTYLKDRSAGLFSPTAAVADGDDATVLGLIVAHGGTYQGLHLHGELDYFTGNVTDAARYATTNQKDLKGMNLTLGAKVTSGPVPFGVDLIYTSGQDGTPATADEININGLNGNYPVGIIITNTGARSLDTKDGTCLSFDGASLGGSNGCIEGHGLMAIKLSSGMTHGPHVFDVGLIWAQSTEDPDGSGVKGENIGIELDATLTWALTKRLSLLGGLGYLMSGDFFETTTNTDPDAMTVLVTQLSYTF